MTVITTRATRKRAWSKVGLYVALLAGAIFAGALCSGCSPARSNRMRTSSPTHRG